MAYDRRRLVYTVLILWSPPVLCNLGTGDSRSDDPSMWQYIVIALAIAFFFMTSESTFSFCKAGCTRSPADYHRLYYVVVLVCIQVARLRRRSESLENGVRPIIHITRSGARVYAPLPILNQEDLDHLDTVEYNGQDIQEQSCSICLDTFHSHTKVRLLPCHHAFHPVCIDPWLTKHSAECPMCKQSCLEYVKQKGLKDHLQTLRNTLQPDSSTGVNSSTA